MAPVRLNLINLKKHGFKSRWGQYQKIKVGPMSTSKCQSGGNMKAKPKKIANFSPFFDFFPFSSFPSFPLSPPFFLLLPHLNWPIVPQPLPLGENNRPGECWNVERHGGADGQSARRNVEAVSTFDQSQRSNVELFNIWPITAKQCWTRSTFDQSQRSNVERATEWWHAPRACTSIFRAYRWPAPPNNHHCSAKLETTFLATRHVPRNNGTSSW